MRTRTATAAIGLIASAALLVACNPNDTTSSKATTPPVASDSPTTSAAVATPSAAPKKAVPNLVGMGLQSAQDAAQAAGFYNLGSHDSAGRGRHQILDRDWKVCFQTPKAGAAASVDVRIDLGAVKLTETCPTHDEQAPEKAGATMPNFVGKSLNTATAGLPSDTSITPTDASGQDRMILVESNWKVCTQSPKAGTALRGQPVTFTAVKFEESCP